MVEVLRSVQMAQSRGQPAQRISFRDIDVEQIGYIYEVLLGYSSVEADELTVGLIGSPGEEPEVTLTELEWLAAANRTDPKLAEAILASVARSQPAAKPPSKNALVKAIRADVEDAERALRAGLLARVTRSQLRDLDPSAGTDRHHALLRDLADSYPRKTGPGRHCSQPNTKIPDRVKLSAGPIAKANSDRCCLT